MVLKKRMYRFLFVCLFTILTVLPVLSIQETRNLDITILYDNYVTKNDYTADWGFSCFVNGTEKPIMFDFGANGNILLANMGKIGINPKSAEFAIVSHDHYDHTTGATSFLQENNNLPVYMLESFGAGTKSIIQNSGAKLVNVKDPVDICKQCRSTGEVGMIEQALVIDTNKGLVIITGCAHPGVVNIVKKAKELFNKEVYWVIGGFHLFQMGSDSINNIIAQMQEEGVKKIAPTHCTGDLARSLFKEKYGDDCILAGVGTKINVESAFTIAQTTGLVPGIEEITWAQIKEQ